MPVEATMSSQGQLVIPKEMREQVGLKRGVKVTLVVRDGGVFVRPRRSRLLGIHRGRMDSNGIEEEVRKLRQEWSLRPTS